jgi:hypothetical protein
MLCTMFNYIAMDHRIKFSYKSKWKKGENICDFKLSKRYYTKRMIHK